jgi:hypothetical protein
MNNRNMALSLMDNINTCSVIFAHSATVNMKEYTYAYDTNKLKLEAGTRVVVEAQNSLKVCLVTKVHEYNEIDVNASYDYALILDAVDTESIAETEAKIAEAKPKVLSAFTGNMTVSERTKLANAGMTLEHKND